MSKRLSGIALVLLALGLNACSVAELPGRDALAVASTGFTRQLPTELKRETVFAATTRAPGNDSQEVFTGFRADRVHFLRHEVTIPPRLGDETLTISPSEAASDPQRHFIISSQSVIANADAFAKEVAKMAAGQRIVLFVHGYNNSYRDALYTMMHIHGQGTSGFRPVLFSFASQAAVSSYGYDKDSALAARLALVEVIETLAAAAPGRIDIAAHSMGTWLTAEALQLIALRRGRIAKPLISGLLLASPDIDADLFDTMWPRIRGMAAHTLVICHEGDRALRASMLIGGGGQRVGSLTDCARAAAQRYPGLQAVDAAEFSATQQDRFLHNPGTNTALVERIIRTSPR